MKKKRRFLHALVLSASVVCAALFGCVVYAAHTVPDEIERSAMTGYSGRIGLSFDRCEEAVSASLPTATPRTLTLFGCIPVKTVYLRNHGDRHVTLGGAPFGCVLELNGILVVGTSTVATASGGKSPAADAGIRPGDLLTACNGAPLTSTEDLSHRVTESNGQPLRLTYERDGTAVSVSVTPAYAEGERCYKLGVWVRDSEAGVGILSFCDEESGVCVGLGHALKDADTGVIYGVKGGSAYPAQILSIEKGTAGSPGQLSGCIQAGQAIGSVIANEEIGVFYAATAAVTGREIEVATPEEVTCGEADLWLSLDGGEPKSYRVRIDKIRDTDSERKNLVLRVVDSELLAMTGGIVQGMSGSPILQGDKLVGVLTHVLIDDPTAGYGIFADSMLSEARSLRENEYQRAS